MGYLDGSAITVDAVLTKQGRRLLANGDRLSISSFCLSDTGVDYNLWNVGHPSGSAYYGEAIENLPQPEAIAQAEYFMRNKLVTLNKDTTALPLLQVTEPNAFSAGAVSPENNIKTWSITTANYGAAEGYFVITPNAQLLNPVGTSWSSISGVSHQFISQADIPSAGAIEITPNANGVATIDLMPAPLSEARTTTLLFIAKDTGAHHTTNSITIPVTVTSPNLSRTQG